MIFKNDSDIPENPVINEEVKDVTLKILIGPDDGSKNIIMRDFTIQPGGNTPFHCHPHEHVVKFVRGKGVVVNEQGEEIVVSEGQNLFVPGDNKHQFRNPFNEPFGFLCIILNPEKD